jgi:hypothetical protein
LLRWLTSCLLESEAFKFEIDEVDEGIMRQIFEEILSGEK